MGTNQEDIQLLERMTSIPSVSGNEDVFIDFIRELAEGLSLEVSVDGVGNVIVKIPGHASNRRLMIFAHLDELGLCVKTVTEDGYLKIDRIGGINRKALPACPVLVHTDSGEAIPGSIGVMAHHRTPEAQRFQVPDIPDLYVDIGASSREEVWEMGVAIGNPITYENFFAQIGKTLIRARALDNKAGCFILIKLLQLLKDEKPAVDTYIVFSVQEEFNVRGVLPAARAINPTAAICVDGAVTGDTPDLRGVSDWALGKGPVVKLMSFHGRGTLGGLIPNPKLRAFVEKVGRDLNMTLGRQANIGGLTDASFLQLLHNGIPCLDIGYPKRYSHSPIETLDIGDLYSTVKLLKGVVDSFDGSVDLTRGGR